NNPLFRRASQALADEARASFRATALGKLASELTSLTRPNLAGASRRDDFEKAVLDAARKNLIPGFNPANVERMLARATRYGMSDFALDALFKALGPLGGILKDLTKLTRRGREDARDRDVEAAINFLSTLGFEVVSPPGRRPPSTRQQNIAAAILEAAGWTVHPPGHREPTRVSRPKRRRPRRERVIEPSEVGEETTAIGSGGPATDGYLPPTPRREGEPAALERVTSSNVWAIGYNAASRTLYVQYKAPTLRAGAIKTKRVKTKRGKKRVRRTGTLGSTVVGRAEAPGPIYAYYDVPPAVARKVIADAKSSSAGEAVWDYLRIRGTIHGHRYDYRLSSVGSEAIVVDDRNRAVDRIHYVPRKAADLGKFQQRTIEVGRNPRTGRARVVRSLLPNEGVGPRRGHGPGPRGPSGPGGPGVTYL
ncbi:MAG: hypothetical protein AB7E74_24790, partial [Pirellulales bacterium]